MTTPRTPEQQTARAEEVAKELRERWTVVGGPSCLTPELVAEAADLLSTLSATVEVLRQEIERLRAEEGVAVSQHGDLPRRNDGDS